MGKSGTLLVDTVGGDTAAAAGDSHQGPGAADMFRTAVVGGTVLFCHLCHRVCLHMCLRMSAGATNKVAHPGSGNYLYMYVYMYRT
jgi:hypothetical protein